MYPVDVERHDQLCKVKSKKIWRLFLEFNCRFVECTYVDSTSVESSRIFYFENWYLEIAFTLTNIANWYLTEDYFSFSLVWNLGICKENNCKFVESSRMFYFKNWYLKITFILTSIVNWYLTEDYFFFSLVWNLGICKENNCQFVESSRMFYFKNSYLEITFMLTSIVNWNLAGGYFSFSLVWNFGICKESNCKFVESSRMFYFKNWYLEITFILTSIINWYPTDYFSFSLVWNFGICKESNCRFVEYNSTVCRIVSKIKSRWSISF